MQQDGFSQYVQVLDVLTQNSHSDKGKINNMRAIFQMVVPAANNRPVA